MSTIDAKALIAHLVEDGGTVVVSTEDFSTLPQIVTNSKIRAEHVSVNEIFSNPSAQVQDWKVVTSDGSLLIDVDKVDPTAEESAAAISGTTNLTLYLNPTDTKGKSGTLVLDVPSFSNLLAYVTNSGISENHVVVKSILSNPSAQTADWKVDTSDGSLTIDVDEVNPTAEQRAAAISGSTGMTLYLTVQSSGINA